MESIQGSGEALRHDDRFGPLVVSSKASLIRCRKFGSSLIGLRKERKRDEVIFGSS